MNRQKVIMVKTHYSHELKNLVNIKECYVESSTKK